MPHCHHGAPCAAHLSPVKGGQLEASQNLDQAHIHAAQQQVVGQQSIMHDHDVPISASLADTQQLRQNRM